MRSHAGAWERKIPSETHCADPHAGCCGEGGLDTLGYPIMATRLWLPNIRK